MKRFAAMCALSMLVAACEAKSPLVPSPGEASPPAGETFTLSGTVADGAGEPIAGARVEAMGQVTCIVEPPPTYPGGFNQPPCTHDELFGSAETDARGAFSITHLPSGYFTVKVSKGGTVMSQGVNVQADAAVELMLPQNPAVVARTAASQPGGR
jgi:hypothetical protein